METNKVNEMMASENISISNQLLDKQAYIQALEKQYHKLREEYNSLLGIHIELRNQLSKFNEQLNERFKYKSVERSGLMNEIDL